MYYKEIKSLVFNKHLRYMHKLMKDTTGMPILNGSLFTDSGHLSRYDGHLGKLN